MSRHAPVGAPSQPVIAFLDCGRWEALVQFAALLRRRGLACHRITTERSALKRNLTRLVFDEVVLVSEDGMRQWLTSDAAFAATDIHMTEEAFEVIAASPDLALPNKPSLRSLDSLRTLHDKTLVFDLLDAADVPQPARVTPSGLADADHESSYPVVVKDAVGFGGHGVHVAETADELDELLAESIYGEPDPLIQEFAPGPEFGYGCVARDGVVLQEATYRYSVGGAAMSQATELVTMSDPALTAAGRATVAAIDGTGVFGLDLIRVDDDEYLVIDVNARPWGCLAALLDVGVDFTDGYLAAVGLAESPPLAATPEDVPVDVTVSSFPRAQQHRLLHDGLTRANLRDYVACVNRYRRTISARYVIESTVFTGMHLARRRPGERRRAQLAVAS